MKTSGKKMNMSDAVREYVKDGDHIVFGGFVTSRKPMAFVHEIIRQRKKNLILESSGGSMDGDLLIGAGCVKILLESYMANSGYTPVCRRFKKAVQENEILYDDYTLDVQPMQYHAAALGLPYIPVKNMLGSDLVYKQGISEEEYRRNPKLPNKKYIIQDNPFNPGKGDQYLLLPAAVLDVAVIHVQYASADGTCRIEGLKAVDVDIAMGATHCIVSCEQIVSPDFLERDPWNNDLPKLVPDAIVEAPYGAHPFQCANFYDYDGMFLREYDKISADDEAFARFLDEYIYGTKEHSEYLNKFSAAHLASLRVKQGFGYVPGLKRK